MALPGTLESICAGGPACRCAFWGACALATVVVSAISAAADTSLNIFIPPNLDGVMSSSPSANNVVFGNEFRRRGIDPISFAFAHQSLQQADRASNPMPPVP